MSAFWAWRCKGLELVKYSILDFDKVRTPSDFDIMPCAVFQHIFGIAPAEGQAMQIDPSDYPAHCPVCDAMYLYDGEEHHMTCRCLPEPSAKAIYHARIMAVKNLEEK